MYRDYHSTLSSGHCKSLSEFLLHEGTTGLLQAPGWDAASSRVPPPQSPTFCQLVRTVCRCLLFGFKFSSKISCVVYDYRTPVHAAAFNDQVECLQLLLSRGGNVDSVDQSGRTPLIMAADNGHAGAVGEPCAQVVLLSH